MEISSLRYLANITFFFKIEIVAVEERRQVKIIIGVLGRGSCFGLFQSNPLGMNFLGPKLVYILSRPVKSHRLHFVTQTFPVTQFTAFLGKVELIAELLLFLRSQPRNAYR
jgi:hypothetical protein